MRISEAICTYGNTEPTQYRSGTTSAKVVAQLFCFVAAGSFMVLGAIAAEAPKPATTTTKAANVALLKELPFADKTAFELAHKGFVAPLTAGDDQGTGGQPDLGPRQVQLYQGGRG